MTALAMPGEQGTLFDLSDVSQRWNAGAASWAPDDGPACRFDARRYSVREIGHDTARRFVVTHHYSRSYPADRQRFGMFEGPHLVGVAVFGQPMHNQVTGKVFPDLDRSEAAELSRFVLLDEVPGNAETWFLARAFRGAAERGLRGVVAFSDPMPRRTAAGTLLLAGHIGVIYRAGAGATGRYTGRGTARTLTLLPDGRVFSDRTRSKIVGWEQGGRSATLGLIALGAQRPRAGVPEMANWSTEDRRAWLVGALAELGARPCRHKGNHRYAWMIGPRNTRWRARFALASLPYPTGIDPEG